MGKDIWACIMARGGSRRIPRKNLHPFCGLPLVEWTFLQARESKLLTGACLVTDDEEIAAIGERYGAVIIWQTHEECEHGIYGGAVAAARFFEWMRDNGHGTATHVNLMPTSPLRKPGELDKVLQFYFDVCIPYNQTGLSAHAPIPHPGVYYNLGDGRAFYVESAIAPDYLTYTMLYGVGDTRSAIDIYGGNITVEHALELARHPPTYPAFRRPMWYYPADPWQAHDIDEPYDLWLAETAMQRMILKGRMADEVYEGGTDVQALGKA